MSRRPAPTPIATKSSSLASASSNTTDGLGGSTRVLGSWEWFEDPGLSIPPEITTITGVTDEMVAGHHIDERAVNDLLNRVVLVIAHNADFDRRFLEALAQPLPGTGRFALRALLEHARLPTWRLWKRVPLFAEKHWACSRAVEKPRVSATRRVDSSTIPSEYLST